MFLKRILSFQSGVNVQKRFLTELLYDISRKNLYCGSFSSCEDVTKYIEFLSVGNCNEADKISDSTLLFNEHVHKMYPYQIVRILNSYATLKFSNENILKAVLTRNEEMCENASPRRALELITLYRNLNLSHEQILSPLTKSLVRHMHNYSYELYALGLNSSYLNITDPIFVESLRTQISLTATELSPLNSIKNLESFSRFREESNELFDSVWNYVKDKKLSVKSVLFLLASAARIRPEKVKLLSDLLSSELEKTDLNSGEISTVLTVKNAKGIVHFKCLEAIINSIEIKLNDPDYIDIYYHIFMLSQLSLEGDLFSLEISKFWNLILGKIRQNTRGFLSPTKAIQLLYTSALRRNIHNEVIEYIKPVYQKLNLRDQELLYDSLVSLYGNSETKEKVDKAVKRILDEKMATILPLMCGNMRNVKLGTMGGKSVIYKVSEDKKLVPQKLVNEFHVLNVVNKEVKVVKSPATLMELEVVEKIHNNPESYGNKVEILIPNEKLKTKLKS
ncbi:hypothetical protein TpMuguga_01g02745 [Theileria parva strain Muguga]|uniref:uncharacterized protein n=1 Tax=Theileria parva strain Muguga TaxID=333668 RepID=UPI001C61799D|nr:uncharacterized protein TpMuguga_01g02745 [Theileria parva strain Muguga]KAF5153467.1 hypothetical protein TpMuguga_01g02745 [Theileria parva strain Muguga]